MRNSLFIFSTASYRDHMEEEFSAAFEADSSCFSVFDEFFKIIIIWYSKFYQIIFWHWWLVYYLALKTLINYRAISWQQHIVTKECWLYKMIKPSMRCLKRWVSITLSGYSLKIIFVQMLFSRWETGIKSPKTEIVFVFQRDKDLFQGFRILNEHFYTWVVKFCN